MYVWVAGAGIRIYRIGLATVKEGCSNELLYNPSLFSAFPSTYLWMSVHGVISSNRYDNLFPPQNQPCKKATRGRFFSQVIRSLSERFQGFFKLWLHARTLHCYNGNYKFSSDFHLLKNLKDSCNLSIWLLLSWQKIRSLRPYFWTLSASDTTFKLESKHRWLDFRLWIRAIPGMIELPWFPNRSLNKCLDSRLRGVMLLADNV